MIPLSRVALEKVIGAQPHFGTRRCVIALLIGILMFPMEKPQLLNLVSETGFPQPFQANDEISQIMPLPFPSTFLPINFP
jgi:hypothetical protein